jgi:hypothetical protein
MNYLYAPVVKYKKTNLPATRISTKEKKVAGKRVVQI